MTACDDQPITLFLDPAGMTLALCGISPCLGCPTMPGLSLNQLMSYKNLRRRDCHDGCPVSSVTASSRP